MSQANMDLPPPPPVEKRNMKVIALAIVCIVLAGSLVGVFAVYQPTNLRAQINDKDAQIKELQDNITALQTQIISAPNITTYILQIASLEQQLDSMNSTLSDQTDAYYGLRNITSLALSTILYQQQGTIGSNTSVDTLTSDSGNNLIGYAGYIAVQVTSNSTTTYVEAMYRYSNVLSFDQNMTVGTSGTAVFPVLPSTLAVKIVNPDLDNTVNASVTITYYY